MSLASSAAEHHVAPQALPLVVTWRRALPSLSRLPVGKGVSDPYSSHPPAANTSPEQPPVGLGLPWASLCCSPSTNDCRGVREWALPWLGGSAWVNTVQL